MASDSRNRSASAPPSSDSNRTTTLRDNPPAISRTDGRYGSRRITRQDRDQVDTLPQFPGGPVPLDPPIAPIEGDGLADLFQPLADFAASIGYTVSVEEIPGSALGYCSLERHHIGVEPTSEKFSANAQVAVGIHELAHALVRCDRREEDPDLTYGAEEVVVECISHCVCSSLGLDTSGWSVPYMANWGEGDEIAGYAKLIDRLAGRLEDAVLALGTPAIEEEVVSA